jgi:hypothetical protein
MKAPVPFLVVFVVAALAAFTLKPPPSANPSGLNNAVILIIRHAEKPDHGTGLSAAGEARAGAYAGYFRNFSIAGQPIRLDYLFASAETKQSDRPSLTLEPLGKLLGLAIDTRFANQQFPQLARELRSLPQGKHILVCWHHGQIPQLLRALGANPAQLLPGAKWPDTAFNWVIQLRYDSGGRLAQANRIEEKF